MKLFKSRILVATITATCCLSSISLAKNTLAIYTNNSFISEWGPGLQLKSLFESQCQCNINWIAAADGAALLAKLRIEGNQSKADVVIGVDDTIWESARLSQLFIKHDVSIENSLIPPNIELSPYFLPYDFSYYAFMFDTQAKTKMGKPFPKPKSLEDLLTLKEFEKSIIVQDPRSSVTGLGLLLWMKAQFGNDTAQKLKQLKPKILTVGKGWSQSYGLFTKGEAPLVFSYITSEAYHRAVEKSGRFQALYFQEGHLITVEGAGILKTSKNIVLSKQFIKFLHSHQAQALIASKNWMLPAVKVPTGIEEEIQKIAIPPKTLHISPAEIHKSRTSWINEWLKSFEK